MQLLSLHSARRRLGEPSHPGKSFFDKEKKELKTGYTIAVSNEQHVRLHNLLSTAFPCHGGLIHAWARMSGAYGGAELLRAAGGRVGAGKPQRVNSADGRLLIYGGCS